MRTMKGLVAGVLLAGLSLACLLSGRAFEAKAEKTATGQSQNRVAINAAANPLHHSWRISAAISFKNLTVFPVVSDEPTSTDEFITLDEGLRSGKVIITELGADGRSRRIRRNGRIRDDADVNKLAVTNRSGKMLVLIAGELLVGGKQDRIVGNDCIVSSTNKPVPINVFCVEHGRWSEEASFGHSRGVESAASVGGGSGPASGGGYGSGGGAAGRGMAPPMAAIAMPNLRAKAQADKSQSEVWNEVAKAQSENVVVTATGDLTSVYRDGRVKGKIDSYERALKNKLSAANVIGVVVAIGDRIISTDVFANHSLFQAYWPKMLKSYALEALNSTAAGNQEVSRSDAEGFLSRVKGESATDHKPGVYKLAENQSSKDASFELQSTARKSTLVHFNRVSKQ